MRMNERRQQGIRNLLEEEKRLIMEGFYYHHSAIGCGYIEVGEVLKERYKGRFGEGYKILRHRDGGTGNHHIVDYWIRIKEK